MVLITIAVFLLNREKIEKRLLKNISFKISNLLKTTVQISDVDFKYNGDLVINNFNIFDHKNDTLIYVDKIITSILTPTNILTSNTKLSSLGLSNGIIKIIKHPGDSLTNFEVFINKVKQDNNTENKNFSLLNFSELEKAAWFSKDFLKSSPENTKFKMPGKISIARKLIKDWLY